MAAVQEHYDAHLAPLYSWMSGGAAGPRARFAEFMRGLDLRPTRPGAAALDLGAGNGFQAIPLAEAGFQVTAIDLSAVLLAELARDAGSLPVRPVLGDLRDFARHHSGPAPELIVCMGDTLTHLASSEDVAQLLREAASALAPGGHLLLSFRDYTTARTGTDRFIPVRSDANRIFTCFLEFSEARVAVHDIVHTRAGDSWQTAVSTYDKIRLAPVWVRAQLATAGLVPVHDETKHGLVTLVARRSLS